ncbi:MAG: FHA domain-containing protein [Fuerstia sp.]|nr:FHA domain-containing protein [Fuerstiella sp.]
MKVVLTVIEGPHAGRIFEFDRHDTFIVGRSKAAQFRLSDDDEFFSRNHFLMEVNPPLCRILDLSSTNGTRVNGKSVTSTSADQRHSCPPNRSRTIAMSIPRPTSILLPHLCTIC